MKFSSKIKEALLSIGLLELIIIQAIFYLGLWMWNEYIASLISMIFIPIFGAILLVSIVSEVLEKSKVPKKYFIFMIASIFVPLVIFLFIKYVFGDISWN